jgi:glucokinase
MLDPEWPTCGCGDSGYLEAFVSGIGIVNRTYQRLQSNTNSALRRPEQLTSKEIFDAEGYFLAMDIVEETRLYLGIGVANLINLYNPGMILFGGEVSQVGNFLIAPALEIAKKRALKGTVANLQFTTSGLGEDVGLIGAAALIKYDDMSSSVQ